MSPFSNLHSAPHPCWNAVLPTTVMFLLLLIPVRTFCQGTTGTIQGSVTNQETGEPIAALVVGLFKPDGIPTMVGAFTNAEGEYTIINVPPGRYLLRASILHYKTMEVIDVLVTIGVTTQLNFQLEKLPPPGSISGTVTDQETNNPIAAVNVILFNLDGTATPLGAFTNAEGEYVIINVPEGRYLLRAAMLRYKMEVQNLLVTAGVTTRQHFQLKEMIGTGTIRGTVVDQETGEPIAKVNVFLFKPDGTSTTIGAFTSDAGEYVIVNAQPGRYLIRAIMPNYKTMEVMDLIVTIGVTTRQHFKLEKLLPQ